MDPRERLTWLRDSTAGLLSIVDRLDPAAYATPSSLPGWSIGHVVAHLHYNAVALGRLATWARTGIETPMYRDAKQRAAEIDSGATRPPRELAARVRESADALDNQFATLTDRMWAATVVTAQGRHVAAAELPWLRIREVVVHAVDLGASFDDYPAPLVEALVADALRRRLARGEGPRLAEVLTGRSATHDLLPAWL